MNTPNNKRRKQSQEAIEKVFIQLIQTKNVEQISVTEICKKAKLNRSTFYANYIDIYDLVEKLGAKLENEVSDLYSEERENKHNSNNFLKLFKHIKENQIFYKTYFKLGLDANSIIEKYQYDFNLSKLYYDDQYISYHIEFFKAGITAIIKRWLNNNCEESAEEIFEIIISEYDNKNNAIEILKKGASK